MKRVTKVVTIALSCFSLFCSVQAAEDGFFSGLFNNRLENDSASTSNKHDKKRKSEQDRMRRERQRAEKKQREREKELRRNIEKRKKVEQERLSKEHERAEKEQREREKELRRNAEKRKKREQDRERKELRDREERIKEREQALKKAEKNRERMRRERQRAEKKKREEQEAKAEKQRRELEERARKELQERRRAQKRRDERIEKARKKREKELKQASKARAEAERKQLLAEKKRARLEAKRKVRLRERAIIEAKRAEQARLKRMQREAEERMGKWDYLYKLPAQPFYSQFYNKKDMLNFAGRYNYASKAYSSSDHTQDVTKLAFGEKPIQVQDILLVSKLVRSGHLEPTGTVGGLPSSNYLYYLAEEVIRFNGEFEDWRGSFDYARRFSKDVSFGFQIPLVHRRHEMTLHTSLSDANKANISGAVSGTNTFPEKYNQNFENFIIDVLSQKNTSLNAKNSQDGIGDISAFVTLDVKSKHVERLLLGTKITFPTSRDRDVHKLWDAEVGNGGFTEIAGYGSVLYAKKKYLNPHLFAQASYSFAAYVDRRVPRVRKYDGTTGSTNTVGSQDVSGLDGLIFADQVKFKSNTPFEQNDTAIRRFASETGRIKLHRGPEVVIRVGNIFEQFLTKRSYLDLFYDFRAKGRDYSGSSIDRTIFDPSIIVQNTYQVAHSIGLNTSYHFDDHFRGELGGLYTFAGRNVPEIFEANAAIKWEF